MSGPVLVPGLPLCAICGAFDTRMYFCQIHEKLLVRADSVTRPSQEMVFPEECEHWRERPLPPGFSVAPSLRRCRTCGTVERANNWWCPHDGKHIDHTHPPERYDCPGWTRISECTGCRKKQP